MFSKEDIEFVDFLFGKLLTHTDTDMIDLQDDDSCDDHIQFNQLSLFWWNSPILLLLRLRMLSNQQSLSI